MVEDFLHPPLLTVLRTKGPGLMEKAGECPGRHGLTMDEFRGYMSHSLNSLKGVI